LAADDSGSLLYRNIFLVVCALRTEDILALNKRKCATGRNIWSRCTFNIINAGPSFVSGGTPFISRAMAPFIRRVTSFITRATRITGFNRIHRQKESSALLQ
jgi:hypothetical protein